MYRKFYLSMSIVCGLILLVFMLFVGYKEISPAWKTYQAEYKKLFIDKATDGDAVKRARTFNIGIKQVYLSNLQKTDRCTSCHVGVENPLMADVRHPFKQHSGNTLKDHPVDRFGCTICHNGQGRALSTKEAHGIERHAHWDYPIMPLKYVQSSCARCHDFEMLKDNGGERVAGGQRLFLEKGCKGCHKLNGIGGVLGNALDTVGSLAFAYFPFKYVKGEQTVYAWHKHHLDDPRNIVPESEMKIDLTEKEADLITTYILSRKSEEIPLEYRRIWQSPLLEEETMDGASLYRTYCISCHTSGENSVYDEIFQQTIPAIMNRSFLKSTDNGLLRKIIEEGRADTKMTAWKTDAAGLSNGKINRIIAYITHDRPAEKPDPFVWSGRDGDIVNGEAVYKVRCAFCHGATGKGGEDILGISLNNPIVQKETDPAYLALTVRDGRPGTPMVPFGEEGLGLDDQDIIDVITYVRTLSAQRETAAEKPGNMSGSNDTSNDPEVSGEALYRSRCLLCHGTEGFGDGPVGVIRVSDKKGRLIEIHPRDFSVGVFKFRSTPTGCLPTDEDLLKTISEGIERSFMPAYKDLLSLKDREALKDYIMTFSERWEEEDPCDPISVVRPEWIGEPASIEKGQDVYKDMKCAECHGYQGVGDGPKANELVDDWGKPIFPFNFTSGALKRGSSPEDVYVTFTTGLDGSGMPSYEDSPDEEDRWHLVSYTLDLMQRGGRSE